MFGRDRLVERSWPAGPVDLLLKAIVAPKEKARTAWKTWAATRDFDNVSWPEMRLLAALSLRIGDIDPNSEFRPRIDGLTKQLWTTTQLALRESASAFDVLARAGIPFIVFKGGALHGESFAPSSRRIMGDVDLLVRPENAPVAIGVLTEAGWSSVNGESPGYLRRVAQIRISGNYRKGQRGEIDLHSTPFHYTRIDKDADEMLWRHSREVRLAMRTVLIPDATDALVIDLAHGSLSDGGDWAVDIDMRIAHQEIDWDRLTETALRRGLVPTCLAGLLYMRKALEAPIPDRLLSVLLRAPVTLGEWLKYWSNVREREARSLVEKAVNRVANKLLDQKTYSYYVKDHQLVSVRRPAVPLKWLLGFSHKIETVHGAWAHHQELMIHRVAEARHLVMSIAIVRPSISRRIFFDVAADGVAVARLRSRSGGDRARSEARLHFSVPLPKCGPLAKSMRVTIEARPSGFLPPNADKSMHEMLGPMKFRIVNAWLV
jgi:hypothetical protein